MFMFNCLFLISLHSSLRRLQRFDTAVWATEGHLACKKLSVDIPVMMI